MIVDAHVSVDRERFPIERAVEVLRGAHVGSAVVFANSRSVDIDATNADVLQRAPEFDLYPFYYLGGNPWTDTRPDRLALPDTIGDYAGIRWHRWIGEGIDREGLLDEAELDWAIGLMETAEFEAVVSAAAHYSLPIIFEESFAVTLEFVLRYPDLDIIIPYLGARSGGEMRVVRALWDVANVYFDTSLVAIDDLALSRIGPHRLLYGSALPEGDPDVELDKIDRLQVSDRDKEAIYGDNLLSLLGQEE